ncbi:hypothetical protein [Thalassococcus sp. S3]|uniref:hypothetical protein n=1 Tax=Thalassococcus sp. S3 TaxID=2017482 RepID=UPI0010243318|nr:hypothetical protein [Thalassococcus sp. S3]QBF33393.1 hypothetical protein CFI11_19575 [Thalassococcus sp. S3]
MSKVVPFAKRRARPLPGISERQRHIILMMAGAALNAGQPSRAVLLLHPLTGDRKDIEALGQLARAYQALGRHDAACRLTEELCTRTPDRRFQVLHVLTLLRSGAREAARACFGAISGRRIP